jgi:hypothetical protein
MQVRKNQFVNAIRLEERKRRGRLFVTETKFALFTLLNDYQRRFPNRVDFNLLQNGEDAPEPDMVCHLRIDGVKYTFYLENKNWTFLRYVLTLLHYSSRSSDQSCLGIKWKFYDVQTGQPKYSQDDNTHFVVLFKYAPPNLKAHARLRDAMQRDKIGPTTLREFTWYLKRLIEAKLGIARKTSNIRKVIYYVINARAVNNPSRHFLLPRIVRVAMRCMCSSWLSKLRRQLHLHFLAPKQRSLACSTDSIRGDQRKTSFDRR